MTLSIRLKLCGLEETRRSEGEEFCYIVLLPIRRSGELSPAGYIATFSAHREGTCVQPASYCRAIRVCGHSIVLTPESEMRIS